MNNDLLTICCYGHNDLYLIRYIYIYIVYVGIYFIYTIAYCLFVSS